MNGKERKKERETKKEKNIQLNPMTKERKKLNERQNREK